MLPRRLGLRATRDLPAPYVVLTCPTLPVVRATVQRSPRSGGQASRSPTHGRPEPAATAVNLNIILEQPDEKLALFGSADRHLRMSRDAFGISLVNRDEELRLS